MLVKSIKLKKNHKNLEIIDNSRWHRLESDKNWWKVSELDEIDKQWGEINKNWLKSIRNFLKTSSNVVKNWKKSIKVDKKSLKILK